MVKFACLNDAFSELNLNWKQLSPVESQSLLPGQLKDKKKRKRKGGKKKKNEKSEDASHFLVQERKILKFCFQFNWRYKLQYNTSNQN